MAVSKKNKKIAEALSILVDLGMPRAQQNERSALALLALLDLSPGKEWSEAQDPPMGITPIMDWARKHYNKRYAPNTRETVRRQTMHQFVQAGHARNWQEVSSGNTANKDFPLPLTPSREGRG